MPTKPLKKGATYADLVRVPEHYVAEMFDGDLYASPRPAAPHIRAATKLAAKLDGPFDFDGPGGWILLVEPGARYLWRGDGNKRTTGAAGAADHRSPGATTRCARPRLCGRELP